MGEAPVVPGGDDAAAGIADNWEDAVDGLVAGQAAGGEAYADENVLAAPVRPAERLPDPTDDIPHDAEAVQYGDVEYIEARSHAPIPEDLAASVVSDVSGISFVLVEPGIFEMGSPEDEHRRADHEGPVREVTLSRPFYMGRTPVTQAQYAAVMEDGRSFFQGDDLPVERVSWQQAVEFARRLSEQEGVTYTLPTEAQWEYACRAGMASPFYTGEGIDSEQANFDGRIRYGDNVKSEFLAKTSPVGDFAPNPWGLYDMHGNVGEWCRDWYGPYPDQAQIDPLGPRGGKYKVVRGGSWAESAKHVRSAARDHCRPNYYCRFIGFRLIREV